MLFSVYKEKALSLLSNSLEASSNKTPAFDEVLRHLNHVRDYYTEPTDRVRNAKYHLTRLSVELDLLGEH